MQVNQLKMNLDKTEVMMVGRPHAGIRTPIVDGVQLPLLTHIHRLGIPLDP